MKLLLLYIAILVMSFGALTVVSPKTSSQSKDSSLLKPTDAAYQDAMAFAQFLNGHGITVKSVHRSKLEGFFQGIEKAAFFRTDKGIVEVIFLPETAGAEKVRVIEQHHGSQYLYSFEGQPHPRARGDRFVSGQPMYFLMHGNWFIMPDGKEFYDALKSALKEI